MKFLTNLYDPRLPDADIHITPHFDETLREAWKRQQEWLSGKTIAEPHATASFTVEELKSFGMVGIYEDTQETSADT